MHARAVGAVVVGAVVLVVVAAAVLAVAGLSAGVPDAPGGAAPELAGEHEPASPGARATAEPEAEGFSPVERALLREAERQAERRFLQERLGGLAALADHTLAPELAACVPDDLDVTPTGADPREVAAATTALRGLDFEEYVEPELLAPAEMAARVEEAFGGRDDPAALETERRILLALGAVTPEVDLREVRVEAFAEQVSGLYSGSRGEVLLRVDDPGALSPLERVVLAHEFEHVLTHQRLGRPSQARDGREDADERQASQALVEGSATLVMLQYAHAALDGVERAELRRALLARAREGALDQYTPYLVAELQYPYTEGLRLACARFAEGGWEAVDAAYADPPDSSLAVLHPERLRDGAFPVAPPVLGRPGGGWRQVTADAFGAADLLRLLEAPGTDPGAAVEGARRRVAAWAGGRLVAWEGGGETVVGLSLAQREGEASLCDTVTSWQEAGWDAEATTLPGEPDATVRVYEQPGRVAALACDAGGVRLAVAGARAEALAVVGVEISPILGMTGLPEMGHALDAPDAVAQPARAGQPVRSENRRAVVASPRGQATRDGHIWREWTIPR